MPRILRVALLLFGLPTTLVAQSVQIRGRVLDSGTTTPIVAAAVRLTGGEWHAVTDSAGRFTISNVGTGEYTLEIEHLGYGKRTQALRVPNTPILQLTVELDPRPVSIGGITVKAISTEERARRAEGTASRVITDDEIRAAVEKGRDLADVLRTDATGLRIAEGEFVTDESPLPARMLCIYAASRGITSFQGRSRGGGQYRKCDMVPVVLDGAFLADPGAFLYKIPLDSFGRIEWLSALAAATRYGLNTQGKGVLVLHTRSGKPKLY
ncbi:MAG: carboxypeptidase-like regulatory domain-containing protein [Longimicrobiales bacterium]